MMIGNAVIKIAQSLLYIREITGHNDHPAIDKMLAYLGLPPKLAWCLAFALWCWHGAVEPLPFPKIARCATFLERVHANEWKYDIYTAEDVAWNIKTPSPGTIIIYSSAKVAGQKNWNGHAVLVESVRDRRSWNTIEGNTNGVGSRDGNGVYRKIRTAKQGALTLEAFVIPKFAKNETQTK